MPSIVELLLLNRAGDRPAKGLTLQNLEGRDLIDTNDPDALFRQSLRIPIAPKDLLRSLFEPGIQTGRLPISGAMGCRSTSCNSRRTVAGLIEPTMPSSTA